MNGAFRSCAWFALNNACTLKCMWKETRQRGEKAKSRNGGLIARLKSAASV